MAEPVDEHFLERVRGLPSEVLPRPPLSQPVRAGSSLTVGRCLELFDDQVDSRHLDLAARRLRAQGSGYYTIGSSGHEGNVAVAAALRPTDPALLHYRSGGFYLTRARQVDEGDPLLDVLLGIVAASDDPISGGRHKVFGRKDIAVIPQTSTIASHLPRSVGVAFAIARAAKLGIPSPWPRDALAVCSFGDASANHSTATGAINAAVNIAYRGIALPLLLVCEDNGLGISVPTPEGWIAELYSGVAGLKYFTADGADVVGTFDEATRAADWVRAYRKPALLHLRTVRLMGHAGSDVESAYRHTQDVAADMARDPVLATARALVEKGCLTVSEVLGRYDSAREEVRVRAETAAACFPLTSVAQIMAPLVVPSEAEVLAAIAPVEGSDEQLTFAQSVNRALADILDSCPGALVFGEDVARKGGVYGVTRGLAARAGPGRVFDTLLDEQTILGLALGAGLSGFLPIPEIQYLAYLHNAEDQLRGEAATLRFFSEGRFRNPMVLRVAAYGYQKGFGGHFHNDNAIAVLRDIPGIVVASPSHPADAASMLHTCVAATQVSGVPCVFLEPIALYHQRDLYETGDDGWLAPYPSSSDRTPIGTIRTYGTGLDLTIVTFGNGIPLALRAARTLGERGIEARITDLRWLVPLPTEALLREATATGRVLVVDETRRSGGVSEGVFAALIDAEFGGAMSRVTSADSFVPLGDAALQVLVSEEQIVDAAIALVGSGYVPTSRGVEGSPRIPVDSGSEPRRVLQAPHRARPQVGERNRRRT
ncbi:thiamine pyrophosphate-dependent enzyme [Rhodococcus sp. NPDC058521]|uniref:thiamine pyrophosphate-dependent enzyme n=1 Tax=Rhodococcus sp. NPDC058521 TaxID=3346536 RepID=UPI0036595CCB